MTPPSTGLRYATMPPPLPFAAAGRLPAPGDNVAIAIRQLEPGTVVEIDGAPRVLGQTVMEGHRFAVKPIAAGEALLSWGLPFGRALVPIAAGEYVCNQSMLEMLAFRRLPFALPAEPNFSDLLETFHFDEGAFKPAPPVPLVAESRTFLGYRRAGRRGTGTRNYIVILGTTSRTAAFARRLAERLKPLARVNPSIDGIVAVAHTEGGGPGEPNNVAEMLRALAGFIVHPNVGAVLAVDYGVEPVTNRRLEEFMREHGYALDEVPHRFMSVREGLAGALVEGEQVVRAWLPEVASQGRTAEPLSGLRVALQCGGSDAFSGVSGNPLAGALVHEVVRHGGIGVLCETDELTGAESYLMKNLRDADLARALLERIARLRTLLGWHGVTPEGNPTAGNKFRGLYNITLKSLGAVHKKDPRTRVDHVIDYAQPLGAPGFYFMDSPGNDLEGIAGQVGAGCNLFLFSTGNGSVTNFPFVPTLKVTTTTRRHRLLENEMDINAGRYLDGESMESLTAEYFEMVVAAASGTKTKGELAGHSQASLWRNWRQTDDSRLAEIRARAVPDGKPVQVTRSASRREPVRLAMYRARDRFAAERVGLVLPTSMCSAQIARLAAERMNGSCAGLGFDRFVALAHSDGCGFSGDSMYQFLHRAYLGYATHPNVAAALLLEHGCEKVPNDSMRRQFEAAGQSLDRFGWASVQLGGGIAKALDDIEAWFRGTDRGARAAPRESVDLSAVAVAMLSAGRAGEACASAFAAVAGDVLASGGTVLLPEGDSLLASDPFRNELLRGAELRATLIGGQVFTAPGLHVVQTDTDHWVENLTATGASGAHVFLGAVDSSSEQGHPLLPVVQVAEPSSLPASAIADVDLVLDGIPVADHAALVRILVATLQGDYTPVASAGGFTDFQLTRGLLGVTT